MNTYYTISLKTFLLNTPYYFRKRLLRLDNRQIVANNRRMITSHAALDWAIERIYEGDSQASIAKALGVSAGKLSEALDSEERTAANPSATIRERSARARVASAEAWLDKGIDVVYAAIYDPSFKGTGMDATAARAYAQECARRAAIRNPAYREKTGVEITGAKGGPIQTIAATATPEQAAALYKELLG